MGLFDSFAPSGILSDIGGLVHHAITGAEDASGTGIPMLNGVTGLPTLSVGGQKAPTSLGAIGEAIRGIFAHPSAPAPGSPPPAPDMGDTTQNTLQNSLQRERDMRASSSLFSSGAGLTDSPMTASRTLLGN